MGKIKKEQKTLRLTGLYLLRAVGATGYAGSWFWAAMPHRVGLTPRSPHFCAAHLLTQKLFSGAKTSDTAGTLCAMGPKFCYFIEKRIDMNDKMIYNDNILLRRNGG
jgi:hypothetical protein